MKCLVAAEEAAVVAEVEVAEAAAAVVVAEVAVEARAVEVPAEEVAVAAVGVVEEALLHLLAEELLSLGLAQPR
jgi:hypothetical protein